MKYDTLVFLKNTDPVLATIYRLKADLRKHADTSVLLCQLDSASDIHYLSVNIKTASKAKVHLRIPHSAVQMMVQLEPNKMIGFAQSLKP